MERTELRSGACDRNEASDTPVAESFCKAGSEESREGSIWGRAYRTVAMVFFNTVLLLLLINVAIALIFYLPELMRTKPAKASTPLKYKEFHPSLAAVYPGLSPDEVSELIKDTRRVPQVYAPYTQFKEPSYQSTYVNVSPHGFRVSKNQGPWLPSRDDFTVLLLGGSTTFGYGVPDNQTIPSYLQDFLEVRSGLHVRVYNFGRCGYFSQQERILLEKLILEGFVPNLVVFIDGLNEFILANGVPSYTKELTAFMLERDIPLARRIARELPLTRPFLPPPEVAVLTQPPLDATRDGRAEKELLRNVIKRYRTNKAIVEAVCGGFNAQAMFVWQPTPLYGYDQKYNIFAQFDYDAFSPHVAGGYRLMAQVVKSESMGDNFLYLADMQENLKEPIYVDAFHYSAKMSKQIAERIGTAAIERGMLRRKVSLNSQPNL